jgi:uncharacterized protein (TIGR02147 family)
MKSLPVFEAKDYRHYLKARAEADENRGAIARLAGAAKCQDSHISRVLSGQHHLTMEQAYRLSRYWRLTDEEKLFFMKLVEVERAGDPQYRADLEAELAALRRAQEDLSVRTQRPAIGSSELEMLYYSAWYWSAVHIIVGIPEFQTVAAIAARLSLPPSMVTHVLESLAAAGLVEKKEKGRWQIVPKGIHLPRNSPLNAAQHSNWRARAVLRSQDPADDGVHFTTVQTVSRADFEQIKRLILETIDRYHEVANPSKEEELVSFTCDFFKV